MAFINEYVSDEDVKKYELEKMWDDFHPFYKHSYKEPGFRFAWTVDRTRNAYFMPVHIGREEYSNQITCVLWIDGIQLVVVLNKGDESTENVKDGLGKVVWYLSEIRKPVSNTTLDHSEIIELLKEALLEYGYDGIWKALPNYAVNFAF